MDDIYEWNDYKNIIDDFRDCKILVVDDDKINRQVAKMVLF